MAVLAFSGANDYVQSASLGINITSALSVLSVVKRSGLSTFQAIITNHDATVPRVSMEFTSTNKVQLELDGASSTTSTTTVTDTTDSWFVAFTKPAGASTGRFHFKNLTTGATPVHEAGNLSIGAPSTQTGGFIKLGNYATGNTDDFNGNIAMVAEFTSELTDAQIDTILSSASTAAIAALSPQLLVELTALTPVDTAGTTTFNAATGATLTGAEPDNWTLTSAGPPPAIMTQYTSAMNAMKPTGMYL